jgi:hypothetical protein
MNTYDMLNYCRARANVEGIIDAPDDDPILLQLEADGYVDRADGCWIARGHIQQGERRLVRHIFGGETWVVG